MIILTAKHARFCSGFCTKNKNFLQWLVWMLLFMHLWQHDTISIIFLQVVELIRGLRIRNTSVQVFKTQMVHLFTDRELERERYNITRNLRCAHCILFLDNSEKRVFRISISGMFGAFVGCAGGFNVIMYIDIVKQKFIFTFL